MIGLLLLDGANADFVRVLVDGTGGTSSSNVLGCRFCVSEFDRGRSRLGTSPRSERCSEFARLRWDEREGVLATGGATGGATGSDCRCDISCLVVAGVGADGWTLGLLAKQPIERREDEGCFLKRTPHGILVSIGRMATSSKKVSRRKKSGRGV